MFLINFTIRRIIEKLESNKFDHAFSSEELNVVGVLGLLLGQGKDSSTKSSIKSVVEEFAHGHLVDLDRWNFVIVTRVRLRIDQLLQILEHFIWMAALHNLVIHVQSLLLPALDLRIEMDFVLELQITFLFLFVESELDLFELGMITKQGREGGSALSSP